MRENSAYIRMMLDERSVNLRGSMVAKNDPKYRSMKNLDKPATISPGTARVAQIEAEDLAESDIKSNQLPFSELIQKARKKLGNDSEILAQKHDQRSPSLSRTILSLNNLKGASS